MNESARENFSEPTERSLRVADFVPYGIVPTASWCTRCVSYPMGVRLAYLCHLLRLRPNVVSILSCATAVLTAWVVAFQMTNLLWGSVMLFFGLQLGYTFDCADGVLARTTGQTSSFGAIFDKTLDTLSMILVPGLLLISAPHQCGMNSTWVGPVMLLAIAPAQALVLVIWLKDYVRTGGSKVVVDQRKHTFFWFAARSVAFLLDTPIFRTFLAVAWMTGTIAEFMIGYGIFCSVALLIYLFKTSRELA